MRALAYTVTIIAAVFEAVAATLPVRLRSLRA
jgi:hypothetical protein